MLKISPQFLTSLLSTAFPFGWFPRECNRLKPPPHFTLPSAYLDNDDNNYNNNNNNDNNNNKSAWTRNSRWQLAWDIQALGSKVKMHPNNKMKSRS